MNPIVSTSCGKIMGYTERGVLKFHGIPYAKAPIGELRFHPPVKPDPWTETLDATYRRPIAPQGPSDLDIPMGPVLLPKSEDCLTLAVSTPSLEGKYPVAVWLHGGANCYCAGDLPWYDGASLAEKGLVVVTVNFRLGPLGFLCYPGLNDKTLCIEDQLAALRWIQENITLFGGDPNRVTLFGQSAGGNSIAHLISRKDTEGLFHQAIMESPSLGRGHHTLADAFEVGENVLTKLGIDLSGDVPAQVWEKTPDEILAAADNCDPQIRQKHQGMIFKPVMDAWHTPDQTVDVLASEVIRRKMRIIIGMTKNEMHAFIRGRDEESLSIAASIQQLRYDAPAQKFAVKAAKGGCELRKYRFDWRGKDSIFNACHCLELPFVFGTMPAWDAPMLAGATMEEMEQLQNTMQKYWGAFFRFEDIDPHEWPTYDPEHPKLKCFNNQDNPVIDEPNYQ